MARGDFPSAKQDQYMLRFPDGMRDRLKAAAAKSGRSMNAEIVHRLQDTLDFDDHLKAKPPFDPSDPDPYEDQISHLLRDMDARYKAILDEVRALNDRYAADIEARWALSSKKEPSSPEGGRNKEPLKSPD